MKRNILPGVALFLLLSAAAFSQTRTWLQDYDKASALAKSSNKILLIDFSGSDWCPWCIRLDKEVFIKTAFKNYARKNLVLMLADFPNHKELSRKIREQNDALAEKYGIEGYPTVILLSPKGELVGQTGYQEGGAEAYVKHLKEIVATYKSNKN